MSWLVLAASLVAVLSLGGGAWWMKRGGKAGGLSPEAATLAAGEILSGFPARTALLSLDRRTALVLGDDWRVAVLRADGSRIVAREVRWSDIRAVHAGLRVETGERRFGAVTIEGVDALDVRRAGGR